MELCTCIFWFYEICFSCRSKYFCILCFCNKILYCINPSSFFISDILVKFSCIYIVMHDMFVFIYLFIDILILLAEPFTFCLKLGTGLSIMISKRNPSLVTTFSLLSCGYIFSSYREVRLCTTFFVIFVWIVCLFLSSYYANSFWIFQVRSVVLDTLNRARFSVAVDTFLKTGQ